MVLYEHEILDCMKPGCWLVNVSRRMYVCQYNGGVSSSHYVSFDARTILYDQHCNDCGEEVDRTEPIMGPCRRSSSIGLHSSPLLMEAIRGATSIPL